MWILSGCDVPPFKAPRVLIDGRTTEGFAIHNPLAESCLQAFSMLVWHYAKPIGHAAPDMAEAIDNTETIGRFQRIIRAKQFKERINVLFNHATQ